MHKVAVDALYHKSSQFCRVSIKDSLLTLPLEK